MNERLSGTWRWNREPEAAIGQQAIKRMMDQLVTVNSSAIRAIGYNDGTLVVQFRDSGLTYRHYGVPCDLYERFLHSSSKGAFYNTYLRGKYH